MIEREIRVPGDKSLSHRALLFSALAEGTSRVRGVLRSADVESTADVLRGLGVEIPPLGDEISIPGRGLRGLTAPSRDLDCGNSGTTTRLMAGVVAASPLTATFIGDASLSGRPMRRVAKPLEAMGARLELPPHGGLPMVVHGAPLHALNWRSDVASAQVKGAILLAALTASVPAIVEEPLRSRDHTERMLAARGVPVRVAGTRVEIDPVATLAAVDAVVPGDPSSAAFFAGLAALAQDGALELLDVGVNPTRTGFFAVLERMGARVRFEAMRDEGGEPTATVHVAPGRLRGTVVGGAEIPTLIDELPLLACLAARAEGETIITGAEELRVKESDRITAVVDNLRAIGVEAQELPDGMRVVGSDRRLAGRVATHGDHRLAMAFGILGAVGGNAIEVDDRACVAAARARGTTVIRDAAELRVKESDRIATMAEGLTKLGVDVSAGDDFLVVRGGRPLRGAPVDAHGDHRVAMALAVAGLAAEGETTIEGWESVAISYPGFEGDLRRCLS